jgi:DNA-binding transcriptional ArsR family regulator
MAVLKVIPADATEPVGTRALISLDEATTLTRLFKIFANETRLRLLHALVREEELCVGDLASALGMKPQAVSNQLQRLVDRGIVASRREGTSIYYHIVDPCVPVLLERGLCLTECVPEETAGQSAACCDEADSACCDNGSATSGQKTKSRKLRAKTTTSRRGRN